MLNNPVFHAFLAIVITFGPMLLSKIIKKATNSESKRLQFWESFADSKPNGRFYEPSMLLNSTVPVYKGLNSLKNSALEKVSEDGTMVLNSGPNSPRPICIYFYQYVLALNNSSKSDDNFHQTIVAMPIKKTEERTYVLSEMGSLLGRIGTKNFPGRFKYEPEGELAQYFDIYIEENQQVSSLTLFDPVAMEYILENLANCDVEIYQDTLYVYVSRFVDKLSDLEKVIDRTSKLAEIINKNVPANSNHPADNDTKKIKLLSINMYFIILTFTGLLLSLVILAIIGNALTAILFLASNIVLILFFANGSRKFFLKKKYQKRYGKNSFI